VCVTGGTEVWLADADGVLTGTDTSGRLGRGLGTPDFVPDPDVAL
jgi:hypothetical protein